MSDPDHPELEGDDGREKGFAVPRLGYEARDAGEGEEDGEEQGGSSTNAGSSQAQRTPAAPDCPPNSSSSLRAFRNSQSQGDAAGKERMGSAGAEAVTRSGVDSAGDDGSGGEAEGGNGRSGGKAEGGDGRSVGKAEGGDGASPSTGWHPTPPAEMQSPFGVSMHLVGLKTKFDADVAAECDCIKIPDPLELPARVQSPSKHRQAATSPRSFTYSSLWSDVDRYFPSDRSASELSSEGSIPPHSIAFHASAAPYPTASSSSIRSSIRDSVRDSVRGSVRDSISDSVHDSVRGSVRDSISDSVHDSVHDSVCDSIREPGYEEQSDGTYSTCALSTPPPDQSEPSVPRDQGPSSFTDPNAQVLEMSGPDHPELLGDGSGVEGFVVPRLGYEEHGGEEWEGNGEEQGGGGRRSAEEAEFSMNLWLGSSYEGSTTTSSPLGGASASSSQAQQIPAAPNCPPDSSSSLRTRQNKQSQGDAAGNERGGRAGAAMSVQVRSGVEAGGDGQSGGAAEPGDGAAVAEGWHPTSPVVVQSPYGVSKHLGGTESGRAEECGDMDRVWEEMYVQRECASLPTSPRDSRRALPAIRRLLTIRRGDFVERLSSRDSFSSTDSRVSVSQQAVSQQAGGWNEGWQQQGRAGGEGGVRQWRRRRYGSVDSIHLSSNQLDSELTLIVESEVVMCQVLPSSQGLSSQGPSSQGPSSQGPSSQGPSSQGPLFGEGSDAGLQWQRGVRSETAIPVARPVTSLLQPLSPRLPVIRSAPFMGYRQPDPYLQQEKAEIRTSITVSSLVSPLASPAVSSRDVACWTDHKRQLSGQSSMAWRPSGLV
ncbi:unnamed protein product [Closterium sp. NIES-64]|nr:unnamed protein product [Closterium sp. NIES-64]